MKSTAKTNQSESAHSVSLYFEEKSSAVESIRCEARKRRWKEKKDMF